MSSHLLHMMEAERFQSRGPPEQVSHPIFISGKLLILLLCQNMMDEVDVIWESSKHRRQDRRPRTPTPPGRRPRTPSPPRQMRPSPPSHARSTSSPPVAVTDLPEKVYSCVSVISLFDKSSQAGVVELQGSNGQRAYCFFLAKVSICY